MAWFDFLPLAFEDKKCEEEEEELSSDIKACQGNKR